MSICNKFPKETPDDGFDLVDGKQPILYIPNVYDDNRGDFSEVLVGKNLNEIRQINRSKSKSLVVRGFHAQSGASCQAKLVEALNLPIYDIIIDARPDSKTFGVIASYKLNPEFQSKVYVPRGFLHGFVVLPFEDKKQEAIFMYYCDNVYNKDSEICISPKSILPMYAKRLREEKQDEELYTLLENENLVYSEKDLEGKEYVEWMQSMLDQYNKTGFCWYK